MVALKLSALFPYDGAISRQPVVLWVLIHVLAGACYVYGCLMLRHLEAGLRLLVLVAATGLVIRALMLASTPVLESDFYRYLWDGALLANGHNPYSHSPAEIRAPAATVPAAVEQLAAASRPVLERVNHPDVTTIYPLAATAVFALAYLLDPWSIDALRGVYLALDLVTVLLLGALLRSRGRSCLLLFVYWCNPVLVRFTYNSLHMDIIVVCLITLLVTAVARRAAATGALALGAAIGTKIWPALLALHLWIKARMPAAAAGGLVLGLALLLPMLLAVSYTDSGLLAYARSWEVNDPVFRLVALPAYQAAASEPAAGLLARGVVALLFIIWLVTQYRRDGESHVAVLVATLGVFLVLQPAPYPWYFLWLAPLLSLRPVLPWIALAATLPLYELRFYFEPRSMDAWFDYAVVLIEFSPLLLLLSRRHAAPIADPVHVP